MKYLYCVALVGALAALTAANFLVMTGSPYIGTALAGVAVFLAYVAGAAWGTIA